MAIASAAEAVLAMRQFGPASPYLADAALNRLIELADASGEWPPVDRMALVTEFTSANGFEGLISVMKSRQREEALQARGCMALSGLTEGEHSCQRAAEAGIFPVLAEALTSHATDIHVLRWGAIAVLRLTYDSAVRAQMAISSGVEEALRGPPGGGVWGKVAPPGVAKKVGLARRWLALHVQLFTTAVKLHASPHEQSARAARMSRESRCSEVDESNGNVDSLTEGVADVHVHGGGSDSGSSLIQDSAAGSVHDSSNFQAASFVKRSSIKSTTVASEAGLLRQAEAIKLRLEENLNKIGDMFHAWDTDGDGTIDRSEFHAAVATLGVDVPDQAVDLVFNAFDADLSGAIDYSEYMLKMLRDTIARDHIRILDLFRQWDADNSGAISKTEFVQGIHKAGYDAKQSDLDRIFDDIDLDGSGEIEYNEMHAKLSLWSLDANLSYTGGPKRPGLVRSSTGTWGYMDL